MEIKIFTGRGVGFEDAKKVRTAVFIEEQGYSADMEFDDEDAAATHAVLYLDGQPAATGRMLDLGGGVFKPGRIAVLKERRGAHLGEQIVTALMDAGMKKGAKEFHVSAQTQARGFYEKLGYTCVDENNVYPDGHIPHIDMIKRV